MSQQQWHKPPPEGRIEEFSHCLYSPLIVNPRDLDLLLTREMPYGKYKGRRIAELPGHYLNWFAREGFPHGEIGQLLALMHELDHNGLRHLLEPLRGTPPHG